MRLLIATALAASLTLGACAGKKKKMEPEPLASPVPAEPEYVAAVQKTLGARQPAFRECYDTSKKREGTGPTGAVKIYFEVSREGRASEVDALESTLSDAAMESCLMEVVRGTTYPAHDKALPVQVKYPLRFTGTRTQKPRVKGGEG